MNNNNADNSTDKYPIGKFTKDKNLSQLEDP